MVEERRQEPGTELRKRKNRFKKPPNAKKMKVFPGMGNKNKISQKKKKLFRKRASEYNSDSDDVNDSSDEDENKGRHGKFARTDAEEDHDREVEEEVEDSDEEDRAPPTKFGEGCNAFRMAFQKIMTIPAQHGPILASHTKLVLAKLAKEKTKKKVDKKKRKKKLSIDEKGHVKLANFLDTHDKVLIGIATKGVVKFFNAVNKAQTAQKGLDPSRFKDAKALTKRRKEAFMSELKRASTQSGDTATKASAGKDDDNQPAWAPLRDSFMLTNSKLKDWDKMAEENETEI